MDQWWHQAGQIMKHVTASANDADLPSSQSQDNCSQEDTNTQHSNPPSASKSKQNFYDRAISIFEKMVENSTVMMHNFEKTNALLERVDYQMDRLINKL